MGRERTKLMKLDLKWIITVAVTVVIAVTGGAAAIVAVPWKLDGRYEQKILAAEKRQLLQQKLEERHEFYLEQISGMSGAYLQSQLDSVRWKLFQLQVAAEKRELSNLEKAEMKRLEQRIKTLTKQIQNIR